MDAPPPLPTEQEHRMEDNAGLRLLLPVGRSGFAITAGYLALVSVLLLPAPFALLFGILAVRDIKKSRQAGQRKYGMGRAIFGIIMGGIFTITMLVLLYCLLHYGARWI